jgi:small subunit ribosomal protein S20
MPVTKSAKGALKVAQRRLEENLAQKSAYKRAVKNVRRAIDAGGAELGDLISKAQEALDTAAKKHVIHKNKASRLKSRLMKAIATAANTVEDAATKAAATPAKAVKAKASANTSKKKLANQKKAA